MKIKFSRKILIFTFVLIFSIAVVSAAEVSSENIKTDNTNNINNNNIDNSNNTITNIEKSSYSDIKTDSSQTSNTTKQDINISYNNVTSYAGKNISITAKFKTSDKTNVNISSSVLKINGISVATSKVVNGTATYNFTTPLLGSRNYTLLIKTGETNSYNSANSTATLTMIRQNLTVKVSNITSMAGKNNTVTAYFTGQGSYPVNITDTVLKINGITLNQSSVVNGVAKYIFTTPLMTSNNYTMELKTGITSIYNNITAYANINIVKQNLTVKVSNITTYAGKTQSVIAKFTSQNVANVNITSSVLKIANKTLASSKVVNGVANYTFTTPAFSAGNYTMQIITGDTSIYNQKVTNATATVNRQNIKISFSNLSTYANKNVNITAQFMLTNGSAVNISSSVLKINGSTQASSKVVNGVANYVFTIPKLEASKYVMMIKTGTTSLYNSQNASRTLTIYRQNVSISYNNLTTYANKQVTVTASIIASNNSKINLSSASLLINGLNISTSKVVNGIANFTFTTPNLSAGKYNMIIKTANDTLFNSASTTRILTILENTKISTVGIKVSSNTTSQKSGNLVVTSTFTASNGTYSTSSSESNAVLVKSGGVLSLVNSTVKKTGDLTNSNSEDSEFYGTNSAVLVTSKSTAYIANTTIITNATGANAVFSSNLNSQSSGATINISNVNISTYKDKSRGLDATYGGIINAEYVIINTRGGSCAALATDRGEGTVNASNCVLNTGVGQSSGRGSPCIYSTGNITATNCSGTSYVSQIGCIEGKNSITLNGCNLTGYACGNRQSNGVYVDLGGFFIYQSMSGDADTGTATLNATNSILTIASDSSYYTTAPMFHITNTASIINLKNCTLKFGSGVLLNISGQDQWGRSGSNGGVLSFTATNQTLTGKTIVDSISSLNLTLKSSTYKGAINPSSSYGTTRMVIDSSSTWTLTGNSYVTSLTNSGTINYGSYTLYVNGVAYTASNPY